MKCLYALCLLGILTLAGCRSDYATEKGALTYTYRSGNVPAARAMALEKCKKDPSKDRVVNGLSYGYLSFLDGDYATAASTLARVEADIAEMDQRAIISARDVSRNFLSVFTNLDKLEYRASCRDRIMLHLIKAMAYLGQGDAAAYNTEMYPMYRAMAEIQDNYRKLFDAEQEAMKREVSAGKANQIEQGASAFGAFRTGAGARAVRNLYNPLALLMAGLANVEKGDWETAKIDFTQLYYAMPSSVLARQLYREILRRSGQTIPAAVASVPELPVNLQQGFVMLVFANGYSAALRQVTYNCGVFKGALPALDFYPYTVQPTLNAATANGYFGTELIADMSGMLAYEYELNYKNMVARTILASGIKDGISIAATAVTYEAVRQAASNGHDDGKALAAAAAAGVFLLGNMARDSLNLADTRCWTELPDQFQVALLPMPPDRKVQLYYAGQATPPCVVAIPGTSRSAILWATGAPSVFRINIFPK